MSIVFKPKKEAIEYENKSIQLPKELIDSI